MNADDYYGLTESDIVDAYTVRELCYQALASRIRVQQSIARNSQFTHPDARIPDDEGDSVDGYGNPLSGDRIINCRFPDCGCDCARLCQAEREPNFCSQSCNIERCSR